MGNSNNSFSPTIVCCCGTAAIFGKNVFLKMSAASSFIVSKNCYSASLCGFALRRRCLKFESSLWVTFGWMSEARRRLRISCIIYCSSAFRPRNFFCHAFGSKMRWLKSIVSQRSLSICSRSIFSLTRSVPTRPCLSTCISVCCLLLSSLETSAWDR